MALDLAFLLEYMPGKSVPRAGSGSGTLSGHAAGEPFDKFVEARIAKEYSDRTFRQAELLNAVFAANPLATSYEQRMALLGPPALAALISRGKNTTKAWTPEQPFVEKQDDTADVVVLDDAELNLFQGTVHLIDVKTHNIKQRGRPPNIISALKLAKMAKAMLAEGTFRSHDITYVGIEWNLVGNELVCEDCAIIDLFRVDPRVYINWSAGLQIQFHVPTVSQDFDGPVEQWLREYLAHFVTSADRRAAKMIKDWADPYRALVGE